MFDMGENSVYSVGSVEISTFRFRSWNNQGGNAIIGVFFILLAIGQVKCGGFKLAGTLGFRSSNPFYLPFLFRSNGVGYLIPRSTAMNNIVNFPTKHLPVYQNSPDEMVILSATLKHLQQSYDKQEYYEPYNVYDLAKQVFQEIREEQSCQK